MDKTDLYDTSNGIKCPSYILAKDRGWDGKLLKRFSLTGHSLIDDVATVPMVGVV